MDITKAKARVLAKARAGRLMILGGFGGDTAGLNPITLPDFDREHHITDLVTAGYLEAADGFNCYRLTAAGAALFDALPPHLLPGREVKPRKTGAPKSDETLRSADGP